RRHTRFSRDWSSDVCSSDLIERVRQSWIAGIRQEKARPNAAALRVMPPLLYGQAHPYGIPFSGTGNEASIASLSREDLLAYHQRSEERRVGKEWRHRRSPKP